MTDNSRCSAELVMNHSLCRSVYRPSAECRGVEDPVQRDYCTTQISSSGRNSQQVRETPRPDLCFGVVQRQCCLRRAGEWLETHGICTYNTSHCSHRVFAWSDLPYVMGLRQPTVSDNVTPQVTPSTTGIDHFVGIWSRTRESGQVVDRVGE